MTAIHFHLLGLRLPLQLCIHPWTLVETRDVSHILRREKAYDAHKARTQTSQGVSTFPYDDRGYLDNDLAYPYDGLDALYDGWKSRDRMEQAAKASAARARTQRARKYRHILRGNQFMRAESENRALHQFQNQLQDSLSRSQVITNDVRDNRDALNNKAYLDFIDGLSLREIQDARADSEMISAQELRMMAAVKEERAASKLRMSQASAAFSAEEASKYNKAEIEAKNMKEVAEIRNKTDALDAKDIETNAQERKRRHDIMNGGSGKVEGPAEKEKGKGNHEDSVEEGWIKDIENDV